MEMSRRFLFSSFVSQRNFKWTVKSSSKNKKSKRKKAEAVLRNPGDSEVTNINAYVSQMLAVSIGIKLCDSARRILMYTKASDNNKEFYALCRGIFPIQELCGTMTALALAKRDVLGWDMPLWKMLAPAVVIHGMANFRGMKVSEQRSIVCREYIFLSLTRLLSYLSANFQVELGNAMVGNAAASMECCRRLDFTTAAQQGLCQAHVAYSLGAGIGLLYQELLSDS